MRASPVVERNFEPIPNFPVPQSPHIDVPDFAEIRLQVGHDATNFQRDNAGLVASGKIPGIVLSAKGFDPNSTTERTLPNGLKLRMNYDALANLTSVEIRDKGEPVDEALVKNGKVVQEGVIHDGSLAVFNFDEHGKIKRETIVAGTVQETLDLENGKVIHGTYRTQAGLRTETIDTPGTHVYRQSLPDGQHLEFNYDDQLKFRGGTDKKDGSLWLISPKENGGISVAPAEEI